jgi:hypothetical protein
MQHDNIEPHLMIDGLTELKVVCAIAGQCAVMPTQENKLRKVETLLLRSRKVEIPNIEVHE